MEGRKQGKGMRMKVHMRIKEVRNDKQWEKRQGDRLCVKTSRLNRKENKGGSIVIQMRESITFMIGGIFNAIMKGIVCLSFDFGVNSGTGTIVILFPTVCFGQVSNIL